MDRYIVQFFLWIYYEIVQFDIVCISYSKNTKKSYNNTCLVLVAPTASFCCCAERPNLLEIQKLQVSTKTK